MTKPATPLAALVLALVLGALLVLPATASAQEEEVFTEGELAQMLAPIALYPDALLAQILMAATYPLEVVEAARWSRDNPHLEGSAAVDAVEDMDWDPSVKALVAFPRILAQMNEDLAWTRNLGDAFLLQEADVAAVIQDLRHRAYEAGHLQEQEHVRVVREREVIYIEPANPRVVYVPYYSPTVVYGGWWWPAYHPVYWYPPHGYSISFGITWVSGVPVSHSFFFSTFNWHYRHVVIVRHYDRHRHVGHVPRSAYRWRHDPWHRRGVAYRHVSVQERYIGRPGSRYYEGSRSGTGSRFSGSPSSTPWRQGSSRYDGSTRSGEPRTRDRSAGGGQSAWQGRRSDDSRSARQDGRSGDLRTRSETAPRDRTATRQPERSSPNFRDRSTYGQQTETTRRNLEQRREGIEQRRSSRPDITWQSRSPDNERREGRTWQGSRGADAGVSRPDRSRSQTSGDRQAGNRGQWSSPGGADSSRGRADRGSRPGIESGRGGDDRGARRSMESRGGGDSSWQGRGRTGRPDSSAFQSRGGMSREERRNSFSR